MNGINLLSILFLFTSSFSNKLTVENCTNIHRKALEKCNHVNQSITRYHVVETEPELDSAQDDAKRLQESFKYLKNSKPKKKRRKRNFFD